tara:strand:+ start:486 stop:743 length:258 start_codon:yes stop_codon:yes gene_type:complete
MKRLNQAFKSLNEFFFILIKTGLLLLGLIVLVYILMGDDSGKYVISVIENIGILNNKVPSQSIVAIILVVGLIYLSKIFRDNKKN